MSGKRKRKQRRKDAPKLRVGLPYYQQIWWDALQDLRRQLVDHCRDSKPDKLRFQNGRLKENLSKRIKAAGEDRFIGSMFCCYRLVTNPAFKLGYDEPRRLHCEEMKEWIQDSPRSFCSSAKRSFAENRQATVFELRLRLASICDWMEAQESFWMWLQFRDSRVRWQGDPDTRARAFQACMLAGAIRDPGFYEFKGRQVRVSSVRLWEAVGVGTNDKGVPWNRRQWANILEQAARLTRKEHKNCTPLEQWVWWCYPVFHRHRWSAREVQDAASWREFMDKDSWKVIGKDNRDFRRYWITRGLRFAGRKTKRTNPPRAEFVKHVSVPNPDNVLGLPIWG